MLRQHPITIYSCSEVAYSMVKIASRIDWLNGLQMHGIKLGLENISELLNRMDNPQNSYPCIHVAGSDGKGSTSAIMASILGKSGLKVGLYTSPDILKLNERIQINGVPISDSDIDHILGAIRHYAGDMAESGFTVTFFEAVTALAFRYFSDEKVDIAIIEVGMGGRFDATNIINPLVSVITNISMEHTAYLGDTLSKIAFEKAGIIKPGIPCVTANTGEALKTIEDTAVSRNAPLTAVNPDSVGILKCDAHGTDFEFDGITHRVSIPGRNEAKNAALALTALSKLPFWEKIESFADEGLTEVRWPCRMEPYPDGIVIDVTHTTAGAEGLAADISEIYGKVILVLGMLSDKNIGEICGILSKVSKKTIVTAPDCSRANSINDTLAHMREFRYDAESAPSVAEAIETALKIREPGDIILITGSFYMAKEALLWMGRTSP